MRKSLIALAVFMMTSGSALAGGILTNTNQSIDFLRNPARDAAIGLDGVYSNPAGVVFMPEGFHLGINWQYAHQTRTITSTNPVFQMGRKNNATSSTLHPLFRRRPRLVCHLGCPDQFQYRSTYHSAV